MAQQPRLINYCISSCINGSDLVMRRIIIFTPIIYRHRNTMIPVNRRIYHRQSGVVMFSVAVRTYVCMSVCLSVCMYVCMYVCNMYGMR